MEPVTLNLRPAATSINTGQLLPVTDALTGFTYKATYLQLVEFMKSNLLSDSTFEVRNATDGTKKIKFDLSGAASGVTKTYTFPAVATGRVLVDGQTENVLLNGDLSIYGNIYQYGAAYETHAEQLYTKKDLIITRDGAVTGLAGGQYSGIRAKLYNGVNDGFLVFDNTGTAWVGDEGSLQPIATRETSPLNGGVAVWNDAQLRFETATVASLNYWTLDGSDVVRSVGNVRTSGQFISTAASGTPPLDVSSTTEVGNLRAAQATKLFQNQTFTDADVYIASGGVYSFLTTAGALNYPSPTGGGLRYERTETPALTDFILWRTGGAFFNTDFWIRMKDTAKTWYPWAKFWHSLNSNLSTADWAAKNLTVSGVFKNARTLVTSSGSGTYLIDFSSNNEYKRTLTGTSVIGVTGTAVIGDCFFIKVTGAFALTFESSGHTFQGDVTSYNGAGGAVWEIGIMCTEPNIFVVAMKKIV